MPSEDIPASARELLRSHVETYEHLEVLLLLGRETGVAWTPKAVATALHIDASSASETLEHLRHGGMLRQSEGSSEPRFMCHPDHVMAINSLLEAHRLDRIGVMGLMTSNALERVRTSALRTFAAAFLLGKKPDG